MVKSKKSSKSSKGKKAVSKKDAPKSAIKPKKVNPLFKRRKRDYTIGNSLPARRDLSRMMKWPRYIRIQRQKAVLYKRLKVPPAINQFSNTADMNTSRTLFQLLNKYRPESGAEKKARLLAAAKSESDVQPTKPLFVKSGMNHVVSLIEKKKAKLVVIAHDVDPIELVVYLPALCRKLDVPYIIVKGKARLGTVVHRKTCTMLAVTQVKKSDQAELASLVSYARENFNNNTAVRRTWGGGILGHKSSKAQEKLARAIAREERRKQKIADLKN